MSAKKKNSTYNAFNDGMKAFEKKRGIKRASWRTQGRTAFARRQSEQINFDAPRDIYDECDHSFSRGEI